MMNFAQDKDRLVSSISEAEVVNLTQQLVRIPSVTGQEKEISTFLCNYFDQKSIPASLSEVEPNRPNIIARLKGMGKGPVIILNGHLDTVPPGEGWTKDPYAGDLEAGCVYGRGAADMKGGLAAMAVAMVALQKTGLEFPGEVVFTGVVGEEENQVGARHLIKSGVHADCAIIAEPTDKTVVNCHKGVVNCDVIVYGKGAHASTPEEGHNAIYQAGRIALALERYADGELRNIIHPVLGNPTLVAGTIQGGQVPYMVADYCKISLDRRLVPGENYDQVLKEINTIIDEQSQLHQQYKASVVKTYATPPLETPAGAKIVSVMRKNVGQLLGSDPGVSSWPAVSDASVLSAEAGIPTVLFGPGSLSRMAHKPDEGVEVEQLYLAAKAISLTVFEILRGNNIK